jgi:hypothetical protein
MVVAVPMPVQVNVDVPLAQYGPPERRFTVPKLRVGLLVM